MSLEDQFWKPPKDLQSKVYDLKDFRKKKKAKKAKTINNYRLFFINRYRLHDEASAVSICHAIANELGWDVPGHRGAYRKFMRKAYRHMNGDRKPRRNHKRSDGFYTSREWKDLRYLALKNSQGACNLCGAMAKDGITLHVDHIKPRSKYPGLALNLNNLQVLCSDCNIGKSNIDETNWRQHWESI